jgi:hypothetical protein
MKSVKEKAAEARAVGHKRFISDRPCRYGHYERYANGKGTCVACARRLRTLGARFERLGFRPLTPAEPSA